MRTHLTLAVALSLPAVAQAGPWTRSAGQAYVKASTGAYLANQFFGNDRTVRDDVAFRSLTQALYAEVGVWDRLQVAVFLPHQTATYGFPEAGRFTSQRFGDARVAVQAGLPVSWPLALRAEVKLPLYDAGTPTGPLRARFPLIGDGQMDAEAWVSTGAAFPRLRSYGFLEVGHQWRTEVFNGAGLDWVFHDGLRAAGQWGVDVLGVTVAANANLTLPFRDNITTKAVLTVGPSVHWPVGEGWALEGAVDATPWTRHAAKGVQLTAGISWQR